MRPNRGELNLSADIGTLVQAITAQTQAIGAQTQAIGALAQSIGANHADHEARLRKLEEIAITLKERMTLFGMGQTVYATVAAGASAVLSLIFRKP